MKTRLYTRKRALISSVAMLLVAMIALGTATFAWFTSNPNAKATGLQLKATAAKGLVILTESHKGQLAAAPVDTDWRHDDYLNSNSAFSASKTEQIALGATSFDLSGTALGTGTKVDAANDNNYAATAKSPVTKANASTYTSKTGDYYAEKVYCKLNGSEETSPIKMTGFKLKLADGVNANTHKLLNAIRVAVEYYDSSASSSTLMGVYSLAGDTSANGFLKGYTDGKDNYLTSKPTDAAADAVAVTIENDNSKFLNAMQVTEVDGKDQVNSNNFAAVDLGTVDKTGNDYVQLTVYLDGQHTDCTTNNIGNASELISSVEINLQVYTPESP